MPKSTVLLFALLALVTSVAPAFAAEENPELSTENGVVVRLLLADSASVDHRILDVQDNQGKSKSFELSGDCGGGFSYVFGPQYDGKRNFLTVMGRYCFYVLNLKKQRRVGPLAPVFDGEGADSQSGMLTDLQVLYGGLAIIGYQVDSGPFVYSLRDLHEPVEVQAIVGPRGQGLISPVLYKGTEKVRLLYARQDDWKVESVEVADRIKLKRDEDGALISKAVEGWLLFANEKEKTTLAIFMETGETLVLDSDLSWDAPYIDWREWLWSRSGKP